MNIRDLMTYSKYLLLLGVVWALASCQREDKPLDVPEDGAPIEMSALIDDSNLTKADAYPLDVFLDKDMVVWGSWVQDPQDNSSFMGDYESGSTNKVFGEYGTKVFAEDANNDTHFTPTASTTKDVWTYQPKRFWHRGAYMFAGVAPATIFNSSFSQGGTFVANVAAPNGKFTGSATFGTAVTFSQSLALDFGANGYDLSGGQDDIMAAFYEVDNRKETAQSVNFNYKHQLSLINIQAASLERRTDIRIDEITVYGNKRKVTGMVLTPTSSIFTLTEPSTEAAPYKVYTAPDENSWMLTRKIASANPAYLTIIDGMLAFPEQFDSFTIIVKYTDCFNGKEVEYTKSGTLTQIKWESGKKYTYAFNISLESITFGELTVESWDTSQSFDNDNIVM